MKLLIKHSFSLTPREAASLQQKLAEKVKIKKLDLEKIRIVAGVDVSYSRTSKKLYAAVVALSFPELKILEKRGYAGRVSFPYLPGLLFFREGESLVKALQSLNIEPDILMVDGHGLTHPRGFGIACHLGVIFGKPSVGVAKKPLSGEFALPSEKPGSWSPIIKEGEKIGLVLRTRPQSKPVYVSPGHLINLESAYRLAWQTTRGHRLPEPIRLAHLYSNEMRLKDSRFA